MGMVFWRRQKKAIAIGQKNFAAAPKFIGWGKNRVKIVSLKSNKQRQRLGMCMNGVTADSKLPFFRKIGELLVVIKLI